MRRRRRAAARPRPRPRSASTACGGAAARTPARLASTVSAVVGDWYIASGLCAPWRAVLHHDRGEVVLGDPALAHQSLGAEREVRGGRGEAGFLAPRLEEARADDALGHLLHAEHEHGVVLPGADRAGREPERGAAARAAGLDVDDRDARCGPSAPSTLWPAATPEYAVPQNAAWKPGRSVWSMPASASAARTAATPMSVTVRSVEPPERVHADAGDLRPRVTVRTPTW